MSYSENNTFEKIMDRMMSGEALVGLDKRVGSVIYNTLAPCAMELANAYVMLDVMQEQTYLLTANGVNLDKRCYDYGIERQQATNALRIGEFKCYKTDINGDYVLDENNKKILVEMEIPVGSRFIVPETNIIFRYAGKTNNYKILECESTGSQGNEHLGIILPLTPIANLIEARITSTYEYGEDEETDSELRKRTRDYINYMAYGGNVADYIEKVNSLNGVGNTKVFPAWQYNGSVLLSVVDPTYKPISQEFAQNLKEQIDPDESSGQGIGIAPIGHFVTITTPVEMTVDVEMTLEISIDAEIGEVHQQVEEVIESYFDSVRHQFSQDVRLAIYRSSINQLIRQNIPEIINVTDILLNNMDADIVYTDEGQIGMQYLPKLGEVTLN